MQIGERVQIRQIFQGAPHWVYAIVHSVVGQDGAVVVIDHSQNPDNEKTQIVAAVDIRTKDDLQKEFDAIEGHDELSREERRALQVQIDRLN